mmetsp:Transcript_112772/g.318802  ORF Transcript_112772/g.318802 Transcript_112772/m.318802 type:complete len:318 (-) Transcript_112772:1579-2532(-)
MPGGGARNSEHGTSSSSAVASVFSTVFTIWTSACAMWRRRPLMWEAWSRRSVLQRAGHLIQRVFFSSERLGAKMEPLGAEQALQVQRCAAAPLRAAGFSRSHVPHGQRAPRSQWFDPPRGRFATKPFPPLRRRARDLPTLTVSALEVLYAACNVASARRTPTVRSARKAAVVAALAPTEARGTRSPAAHMFPPRVQAALLVPRSRLPRHRRRTRAGAAPRSAAPGRGSAWGRIPPSALRYPRPPGRSAPWSSALMARLSSRIRQGAPPAHTAAWRSHREGGPRSPARRRSLSKQDPRTCARASGGVLGEVVVFRQRR